MKQLTFGSLFAGIGGFDLGFEQAGLRPLFQVEINSFCQRVLANQFPKVPRYEGIKSFPPIGEKLLYPDVLVGGFPCVDISLAGRGAGIIPGADGSGLWSEFSRVIRLLRPRYVVVENSPVLTVRGLHRLLCALADSG